MAEKIDHYPINVYNRVEIVLSSHDAGGLSQKDIEPAYAAEETRAGLRPSAAAGLKTQAARFPASVNIVPPISGPSGSIKLRWQERFTHLEYLPWRPPAGLSAIRY